jgi:hypothetical protein
VLTARQWNGRATNSERRYFGGPDDVVEVVFPDELAGHFEPWCRLPTLEEYDVFRFNSLGPEFSTLPEEIADWYHQIWSPECCLPHPLGLDDLCVGGPEVADKSGRLGTTQMPAESLYIRFFDEAPAFAPTIRGRVRLVRDLTP